MKSSLLERVREYLRTDLTPGKEYFADPSDYEREILTGVKWEVNKYGHILLDKHSPYKQGQLTTIIGHTNVGKTTLILHLLSRLLTHKKVLIYSAENRVSQIARHLLAFHFGHHSYQKNFGWLSERVKFIRHAKQFTYRDMLEQTAIADDIGFNADIIFIDPYNALKIDAKRNGHEYHYEAIEDMRIYTMTTGKSIFLNCHTVTDAQRTKPDQYGEIKPPIMADVEGGAKFPNKSDDVWVMHRNLYSTLEEKRFLTELYVGKVRNTEGGGLPTSWDSPIKFRFKADWTGFTCEGDQLATTVDFTESKSGLPF